MTKDGIRYMFFKSKKSHGSMKVLSETEIQKKLYGDYRDRYPKESRGLKSERREKVSLNIALHESESQPAAGDLFRIPPAITEPNHSHSREETPLKEKEHKAEQARMHRLASLAESEKKLQSSPRHEKSEKTVIRWPKVGAVISSAFSAVVGFLWAGVRGIGRGLLKAIVFFLSFGVRAVRWFDFRRSEVRRITFAVLGLVALFALFASIHFLNVRREKAMKSSGTRAAAVAKATPKASSSRPRDEETAAKSSTMVPGDSADVSQSGNGEATEAKSNNAAGAVAVGGDTAQTKAKRYVIQVATYSNSADADRIVESLKGEGAAAFSKSLTRPSGKVYYSVFIGRYSNFEQAQQNLESFRKKDASKSFQDAFIRTLD